MTCLFFSIRGTDASWEHDQEPPAGVRKYWLQTFHLPFQTTLQSFEGACP